MDIFITIIVITFSIIVVFGNITYTSLVIIYLTVYTDFTRKDIWNIRLDTAEFILAELQK